MCTLLEAEILDSSMCQTCLGERGGTVTKPRGGEGARSARVALAANRRVCSKQKWGPGDERGGRWLGEHSPILPAPWDPRGGEKEVQGAAGTQREGIEAKSPSTRISLRYEPAGNCLCHQRGPQITKPPPARILPHPSHCPSHHRLHPPLPRWGGLESSPSPPATPLLTRGQGVGVGHSNFMSSTSKIRVALGGMIPGWPVEP